MMYELLMNHISSASIFAIGLICLFLQMIMVFSLNSYVKASANMKTTKKKLLINLKTQYEAIYDMDGQIQNTKAYVDKYLLKLKFMGISYNAWERVPYLATGMVTAIAVGEGFYHYVGNAAKENFIEILFAYGITVTCFYMFYHIFGVKNKEARIQIQLVDYLENYLSNRLHRSNEREQQESSHSNPEEQKLREKEGENRDDVREDDKVENADSLESDMDMLKRLIKEMEEKHTPVSRAQMQYEDSSEESISQIAVSEETSNAEENSGKHSDDSDVDPNLELLEEFVQSFLA